MANQGLRFWFLTLIAAAVGLLFPEGRGGRSRPVSRWVVTLPAADKLNREGSGLAVIGGLTPEVVGVGDFPLELRGFRILAVVDRWHWYRCGPSTLACCGSPIRPATVQSCAELLGEPDLGDAGGGRAGHLQRAVFRRLSIPFAEHGEVLAEQQFGGGPVEPEHGMPQTRRVGVGGAKALRCVLPGFPPSQSPFR